jgi:hypothetical protein
MAACVRFIFQLNKVEKCSSEIHINVYLWGKWRNKKYTLSFGSGFRQSWPF